MGGKSSPSVTEVKPSAGQERAFNQAADALAMEQSRLETLQSTLTSLQPFIVSQVQLSQAPDRASKIAYSILNGEEPTRQSIGPRPPAGPAPVAPAPREDPWQTQEGQAIRAAQQSGDPVEYWRRMGRMGQLSGREWQKDVAENWPQIQARFEQEQVKPYQAYVQQKASYDQQVANYKASNKDTDAAWQEDLTLGKLKASQLKQALSLSDDLSSTDYWGRFDDLMGELDNLRQEVPVFGEQPLPPAFLRLQSEQQGVLSSTLRKQLGTGWAASGIGQNWWDKLERGQTEDRLNYALQLQEGAMKEWQAKVGGNLQQLETETNLFGQKAQSLWGNLTGAFGISDLQLSEQAKRLGVTTATLDTLTNALTAGSSVSYAGLAQQAGQLGGIQAGAQQGGTIVQPGDNSQQQMIAAGGTAAAGIAAAVIIAA